MKKICKSMALLMLMGVLLFGTNFSTYAIELSTTTETDDIKLNESKKVDWWKVGWKILTDYVEKLFDVDGKSEKNSTWVYLVSPSIEFNTGTMGNEVYFRPEVDNTVGTIRMHGHRIIFVDIFSKINLILSDANNDTVESAAMETNQYMFYYKESSDKSGSWKAQFISADTYKWQCYYAHYYKNARLEVPETEDGFYFGENNRVFQFSEKTLPVVFSTKEGSLTMTELNNQFYNPADGEAVDYLKDYAPGDIIEFEDIIFDIKYDPDNDATTIYFNEDTSGNLVGWIFNSNLSTEYSIGDKLQLSFQVVKVGEYNGIVFESLDYFEEAYAHEDGTPYPNISDYK